MILEGSNNQKEREEKKEKKSENWNFFVFSFQCVALNIEKVDK
jgi:hypothetical protein